MIKKFSYFLTLFLLLTFSVTPSYASNSKVHKHHKPPKVNPTCTPTPILTGTPTPTPEPTGVPTPTPDPTGVPTPTPNP